MVVLAGQTATSAARGRQFFTKVNPKVNLQLKSGGGQTDLL